MDGLYHPLIPISNYLPKPPVKAGFFSLLKGSSFHFQMCQRAREVFMFIETIEFIGGTLSGLTFSGKTTSPRAVGFTCFKPVGGSPYRVVSVVSLP
jgi:hypothetical protein